MRIVSPVLIALLTVTAWAQQPVRPLFSDGPPLSGQSGSRYSGTSTLGPFTPPPAAGGWSNGYAPPFGATRPASQTHPGAASNNSGGGNTNPSPYGNLPPTGLSPPGTVLNGRESGGTWAPPYGYIPPAGQTTSAQAPTGSRWNKTYAPPYANPPPVGFAQPQAGTAPDGRWDGTYGPDKARTPTGSSNPGPAGRPPYPASAQPYQVPGGTYPNTFAAPSPTTTSPGPPVGPLHPGATPASPKRGSLIEPAQVVATVGPDPILAGDLYGDINLFLEKNNVQSNVQIDNDEWDEQRKLLMQQLLQTVMETRLVYNDFRRNTPPEHMDEIIGRVESEFDKAQMGKTLKKHKVSSRAELDAKLRKYGSSIEKLRQAFVQSMLAREMIRRNVKLDREVTHREMLEFYRENIDDYTMSGKAEWEELMVEFPNYRSRDAAWREIAELGNHVLRGAPLSAVARRSRQGPRAEQGGRHEWTTQGSLRSEPLDHAIFSFPIGQLSPIIENQDGLHIIRVIKRIDAHRISFEEAQTDVKEKIQENSRQQQLKEYVARLRKETPVWTIFDDQGVRDGQPDTESEERISATEESRYSRQQ